MPDHNATRVIAIRHGETAWNADARIQGHTDIPLNDTGRWQAEQLAQALADERLDALYASDLGRALETARAVSLATGCPVQTDAGLRERRFGEFEGLSFEQIEARWPAQALRWRQRDPSFGPRGGESLVDFYTRVVPCAQALASRHRGGTIALVAHGGVLDCLYRAATRLDLQAPRTWLIANASINRLLCTAQGFTLVGWADTQHLDTGTLDENADAAPRQPS